MKDKVLVKEALEALKRLNNVPLEAIAMHADVSACSREYTLT